MVSAGLFGWLIWAALAAATPDVRTQIVDFRVVDEHRVGASLRVTVDPDVALSCTVAAQDRRHETTGVATISIPKAAERTRTVPVSIKTRERAVVVTVTGCRHA